MHTARTYENMVGRAAGQRAVAQLTKTAQRENKSLMSCATSFGLACRFGISTVSEYSSVVRTSRSHSPGHRRCSSPPEWRR